MKRYFLATLAVVLAIAACSGSTGAPPGSPDAVIHGVEPLPEGRWTELARELVAAEDLATATHLTREILARGGMATTDGQRVLVEPIGPAVPYQMTALEARNLAMEARNRDTAFRLHASEFAQFLDVFVWDRGGSPDRPAWLSDAQAKAAHDHARSKVDAARAAVLDAQAGDPAAQERIERLDAAATRARAVVAEARAASSNAPRAEREALYGQLEIAREKASQANLALREARREAERTMRERTSRAVRAREQARSEFFAWRAVGPDYDSGAMLLKMLDTWVRAAAENPDDPESFTPLFLAEMARLQQAPFDLLGSRFVRPSRGGEGVPVDLRGGPRADDYRLTLLEMQLFLAAFQRGQPAPTEPWPATASRLATGVADFLLPPAHAQASLSACADIKRMMGADGGAGEWGANTAAAKAYEAAGRLYGLSKATIERISRASKILRVVIQYANTEARVQADQGMVHKPPSASGPEGHGTRHAWYTAAAGVDPEDLENYEESLKQEEARSGEILNRCFGSLELPSVKSLGEIAEDAEKWRVEWGLRPLHPEHMNIRMGDPDNAFLKRSPSAKMQLRRASPAHAEARLKAQVAPEEAVRGEVAIAHHNVVAEVVDTGTPGFGEMVNAVKGIFGFGMTDVMVDLAAGWMKHILVPRASALQVIEYHCLDQDFIRRATRPVGDGPRRPRTRDHCVLPAPEE